MRKKIVSSPDFFDELEDLLDALVVGEYFSSIEWASQYIDAIELFIEESIGFYPSKPVPASLSVFGTFYISYKHNQRTTWYIMFDETEESYYLRHILNNHIAGHFFNE